MNDTHNYQEQARRSYARVFSEFELACQLVNAARYQTKDKQVLMQEDVQRLQSLIKLAQKKLETWEAMTRC